VASMISMPGREEPVDRREVLLPDLRGAVDVEELGLALVTDAQRRSHGEPDVRVVTLGVADRDRPAAQRPLEGVHHLAVGEPPRIAQSW
jgi:hypothetical protein